MNAAVTPSATPTPQARRETARSFQLGSPAYSVTEKAGSVKVTVTRAGDSSEAAAVGYATVKGTASDVSDYTRAAGRLYFAPGETEKTFDVHVIRDARREGTETAKIELTTPSGGAQLGAPSTATLSIIDDEQKAAAVASAASNGPIDDTAFFVRQHYLDFLNREPDAPGLNFWTNEVEGCGADAQCREVKRINVSAAFFLSIEFKETGYLVYRSYKAAFGNLPGKPVPITLSEFLPDTQSIGAGVVVNSPGWEQVLETNKQNYFNSFVTLPRFTNAYPATMTPSDFVGAMNANSGGVLSAEERDALVSALATGAMTRAQVLRATAEDADMQRNEFNRAFVLMQYFGYLRRNPNDPPEGGLNFDGYNFWLGKLNQFNGNFIEAEMVKAFISSIEYLARFGTQTLAAVPNKARAGEQLTVELTGQFTNFIQGTTRASFGEGISVGGAAAGGFGPVTVTSRTTATAQLAVSSAAVAGPRTVTITTGPERVSLDNGFTVESNAKAITSIQPGSGKQGQSVQVSVTGQNTSFAQGTTQANFGAGITVAQLTVSGPTSLTAQLNIAETAAPGARTVTITTGAEEVRSVDGFAVEAALPVIALVQPNTGQQGQSLAVSITGKFTNFAQGTTRANFGAGISVGGGPEGDFGPVAVTSPTSATAQIKITSGAATGQRAVTVRTGQEEASVPAGFVVTMAAPPQVNDFTPKSAPAGTLVSVNGSNFTSGGDSAPQVFLQKQGGGTIPAPVSGFGPNTLAFVIPPGAASGQLTVTTNGLSATSADALSITASSGFKLTAVPGSADAIKGQSVSYALKLSSTSGFSQLANLTLSGLPAGVTASFKPQQVTAGQSSVLTLGVPASQAAGAVQFTATASSVVDGINITDSTPLTLNVQQVTTSFLGRTVVADTSETPLAGVTVRFMGKDSQGRTTSCAAQTASDAAGNFAFTNLPAGCVGEQLIRYDGLTATAPPGHYAGVDLVYTIVANQVTTSPVLVHLPRIDNQETVMVQQNAAADQHFDFATIPNLSVTVYAGTTFTMPDGSRPNPFPLTAVQVPVDRLPDSKAPNPSMVMVFIVAFQPANATASQPVPVTFPNTINTAPGTNMVLMTLDPTKGSMVPYGSGTVSNDGAAVVPDLNPSTPGKRYGLVHFDWHGQMPPPPPTTQPSIGGPTVGGAVDIASGLEVFTRTDVNISGGKGGLTLSRTYRTLSNLAGPFGIGTSHNYDYRLDSNAPQGAAVVSLVLPDSNRVPFTRQPNGTLLNLTAPAMRGAVMNTAADGTATLRFKDGTLFTFAPGNILTGSVLTSTTDPNGNVTTLTRSSASPARILEIGDAVGRKLTLAYDFADRVTSVADPIGRVVRYSYDGSGHLASVTDAAGGVTKYEYNAQNNLSRVIDPAGTAAYQNTYDSNGRVVEQVQADGGRTRYSYTVVNPLTPTSPVIATVVTDPLGRKTTYRFNTQGYLTDVTDPTGQVRVFERQQGTNLLLSVKGAGVCDVCGDATTGEVSYTYDGNGNVLTHTDALGDVSKFTYDPVFNKIETFTDPLGNVSKFTYDSRGNPTSLTDARGNVTSVAYNNAGQVVEVTDAAGKKTTLSYDSVGNMVSTRDALGNTTGSRFDAVSRVVEQQDALGNKVTIAYDNLDRITSFTDARGNARSFTFDAVGNMLSFTDANNNKTSFAYDLMRRVTKRTDPLGRFQTYAYNSVGRVTQIVDRRGKTAALTYDGVNRLLTETFDDAKVTRAYDSQGRLARVEDTQGGVFTFSYDAAGRLTRTVNQFGAVDYTRDALGRVSSRQVLGQPKEDFAFDAVGNLTKASMPLASVTMSYDERNLLQSLQRSNGVSTAYAYDAAGRLLSRTHGKGGEALDAQGYVYDAAGRRSSSKATSNRALTTEAATGEYDAANQLKLFGARSYTHDANGNRLTETGVEGQTTYTWDARNRLQSVAGPDGQTTSFVYDFGGNLMQQKVSGAGAGFTRTYVLDHMSNVAFQSNSAGEQLSFLTGGGIDEHLAAVDGGGKVSFALTGTLGSVVAHTGETGAVEGRASYEPFGKTATTGARYPFEYSGRQRVSENLYYYRARFYDPLAGRFLSEDPVGLLGGSNLYQFNLNDPINHSDPLGLWAGIDDAIAAGGGALAGLLDRGLSDLVNGQWSGWEDYAGAAIGGAVAGETFLYTGNPILAGAAGGAAGNLTKQGLNNLTGRQCGFDAGGFLYDTGTGGLVGLIGNLKIPGLNKGRGSFKAVERNIVTRFRNGSLKSISAKTAGKIITVEGAEFTLEHGSAVAANVVGDQLFPAPGCPPKK